MNTCSYEDIHNVYETNKVCIVADMVDCIVAQQNKHAYDMLVKESFEENFKILHVDLATNIWSAISVRFELIHWLRNPFMEVSTNEPNPIPPNCPFTGLQHNTSVQSLQKFLSVSTAQAVKGLIPIELSDVLSKHTCKSLLFATGTPLHNTQLLHTLHTHVSQNCKQFAMVVLLPTHDTKNWLQLFNTCDVSCLFICRGSQIQNMVPSYHYNTLFNVIVITHKLKLHQQVYHLKRYLKMMRFCNLPSFSSTKAHTLYAGILLPVFVSNTNNKIPEWGYQSKREWQRDWSAVYHHGALHLTKVDKRQKPHTSVAFENVSCCSNFQLQQEDKFTLVPLPPLSLPLSSLPNLSTYKTTNLRQNSDGLSIEQQLWKRNLGVLIPKIESNSGYITTQLQRSALFFKLLLHTFRLGKFAKTILQFTTTHTNLLITLLFGNGPFWEHSLSSTLWKGSEPTDNNCGWGSYVTNPCSSPCDGKYFESPIRFSKPADEPKYTVCSSGNQMQYIDGKSNQSSTTSTVVDDWLNLPAVYCLCFPDLHKVYIGSTASFEKRIRAHLNCFKRTIQINKKKQATYHTTYGCEAYKYIIHSSNVLVFPIKLFPSGISTLGLRIMECYYIQKFQTYAVNVASPIFPRCRDVGLLTSLSSWKNEKVVFTTIFVEQLYLMDTPDMLKTQASFAKWLLSKMTWKCTLVWALQFFIVWTKSTLFSRVYFAIHKKLLGHIHHIIQGQFNIKLPKTLTIKSFTKLKNVKSTPLMALPNCTMEENYWLNQYLISIAQFGVPKSVKLRSLLLNYYKWGGSDSKKPMCKCNQLGMKQEEHLICNDFNVGDLMKNSVFAQVAPPELALTLSTPLNTRVKPLKPQITMSGASKTIQTHICELFTNNWGNCVIRAPPNTMSYGKILNFINEFGLVVTMMDKFPKKPVLYCSHYWTHLNTSAFSDNYFTHLPTSEHKQVLQQTILKPSLLKPSFVVRATTKIAHRTSQTAYASKAYVVAKPKFFLGLAKELQVRQIINHSNQPNKCLFKKTNKALTLCMHTLIQHLKTGYNTHLNSPPPQLKTPWMQDLLVIQPYSSSNNTIVACWTVESFLSSLKSIQSRNVIHSLIEWDFNNMFFNIPTKNLLLSLLWFFSMLMHTNKHFVNIKKTTSKKGRFVAAWGSSNKPGAEVFSIYTLLTICLFEVQHNTLVKNHNNLYSQKKGVPIGGLLSSVLAEIYLIIIETKELWNPNNTLKLHRRLKSYILAQHNTLYDPIKTLVQEFDTHALPQVNLDSSKVRLLRYRDNIIGACVEETDSLQSLQSQLQQLYCMPIKLEGNGHTIRLLGLSVQCGLKLLHSPVEKTHTLMHSKEVPEQRINYSIVMGELARWKFMSNDFTKARVHFLKLLEAFHNTHPPTWLYNLTLSKVFQYLRWMDTPT